MKNRQIKAEIIQNHSEPQIVTQTHHNSHKLNRFGMIFTDLGMIFDRFRGDLNKLLPP